MSEKITYTAITFAPVQGFIEKSRKLRDLYGSSFLLSYLARGICKAAKREGHQVISPAQINVTQGTPNQIIIKGYFSQESAKEALQTAWKKVTEICREWIKEKLPNFSYCWDREWNAWTNYAWEFFWASKEGDIGDVRTALSNKKQQRDWTGINWKGESSTLSGGDGIAWYGMGDQSHPKNISIGDQDRKITEFYQQLSQKVGEAILDPTERLSIPELIKRLITLKEVGRQLTLENVPGELRLVDRELPSVEIPETFTDLNRKSTDPQKNFYTGWFQGDGDSIASFLKKQAETPDEAASVNKFSLAMMEWGENFKYYLPPLSESLPEIPKTEDQKKRLLSEKKGRIVYAGGDDFLGVLYDSDYQLKPQDCLQWFYRFNRDIWPLHKQPITVSIGFVWAAPGVPQRDVLQHCREAEKSAKNKGRDRLAIRILFNSGNHLEWVCPWWFLKTVLSSYLDRSDGDNWTHFYNDVAVLESRHAFTPGNSDVALGLFEIYFNADNRNTLTSHLWDKAEDKGILGNNAPKTSHHQLLNEWIINLAKVGFHLCLID